MTVPSIQREAPPRGVLLPAPPKTRDDLLDWVLRALYPFLRTQFEATDALLHRLTRLNLSHHYESLTTPGVANTQFTVNHNLMRIPDIYIYNIDKAGTVYDDVRGTWTTTQMYLKCSVVTAKIYLLVI